MGVSIYQDVSVGITVTYDDLTASFVHNIPEVVRYENRFDPKTGDRIDPAKIVEKPAEKYFELDGERYGKWDAKDLAEAVAKKLDCRVEKMADHIGGSWHEFIFGYGIGIGGDEVRCLMPGYLSLSAAAEQLPVLQELKIKIEALGIRASEPQIINCVSAS